MTVGDLIDQLLKLDGNTVIALSDGDGYLDPIGTVKGFGKNIQGTECYSIERSKQEHNVNVVILTNRVSDYEDYFQS